MLHRHVVDRFEKKIHALSRQGNSKVFACSYLRPPQPPLVWLASAEPRRSIERGWIRQPFLSSMVPWAVQSKVARISGCSLAIFAAADPASTSIPSVRGSLPFSRFRSSRNEVGDVGVGVEVLVGVLRILQSEGTVRILVQVVQLGCKQDTRLHSLLHKRHCLVCRQVKNHLSPMGSSTGCHPSDLLVEHLDEDFQLLVPEVFEQASSTGSQVPSMNLCRRRGAAEGGVRGPSGRCHPSRWRCSGGLPA